MERTAVFSASVCQKGRRPQKQCKAWSGLEV